MKKDEVYVSKAVLKENSDKNSVVIVRDADDEKVTFSLCINKLQGLNLLQFSPSTFTVDKVSFEKLFIRLGYMNPVMFNEGGIQ